MFDGRRRRGTSLGRRNKADKAIHSKSEQIGGDLLLSTEKLAEKVRISGRQNFATNVH